MQEFDLQAELKVLQEFQVSMVGEDRLSVSVSLYQLSEPFLSVNASRWNENGDISNSIIVNVGRYCEITAVEAISKIKQEIGIE